MNVGNAGSPDAVSAIALAKVEASEVSNDGRSRGSAGSADLLDEACFYYRMIT
jgi:hypothetical protein